MEWTFRHCFSIPRTVTPGAFDPVAGDHTVAGDHGDPPAVLRDVRVLPQEPTEEGEGWTDWCVEGRLEAEDMGDEAADDLVWEVFSGVAYDRIAEVVWENEWVSGDTRRATPPQPRQRHPWGIPLEENSVAQLRARLMPPPVGNPWEYEREVAHLERMPVEHQARLYAVMQALATARAQARDAERRGDPAEAATWRERQRDAEDELGELEEQLGLEVGEVESPG